VVSLSKNFILPKKARGLGSATPHSNPQGELCPPEENSEFQGF